MKVTWTNTFTTDFDLDQAEEDFRFIMKQKKVKTNVEMFMSERKSWGNVNPVTRVIPDKWFKKPKYKGRDWE